MIDATLVTIHGFWSSPATWDRLIDVWRADEALRGLRIHSFGYPSPKKPQLPLSDSRVPDYDDIAQILATEYATALSDAADIAVVTHSQGGLILQRFLAWMVSEGRARELNRIRSVVMLACPNGGSEYLESLRRILGFGRHPQAGSLHVLNRQVADTQRTVLQRIVNAVAVDECQCRIPFHVYAGGSDDIVRASSAQAAFPGASTLAGNHFTVLDPAAQGNRTAETVKRHLLDDITGARLPPGGAPAPCLVGEIPATAEHYQRRSCDDDLRSALASSAVVVLSPERVGLSGVGITQLAGTTARYLWESQDIDVLVWVRADERERVVKGYEEAATVVGTDDFLSWLARTKRRWLVVFDDFTDPAQLSGLWPPTTRDGRVLVCAREWHAVTGQENGMRGLARRIEVGPFRPDEATAYVMASLECTGEEAAQLAQTLRFQPLALGEATSYIRARGVDCRQYLKQFTERQRLLPRMLLGGPGQADVQRSAVTVAWSLGVDRHDLPGTPADVSRTVYQMTSGPDGTQTMTLNVDGAYTQLLVERLSRFLPPEGGPGNG